MSTTTLVAASAILVCHLAWLVLGFVHLTTAMSVLSFMEVAAIFVFLVSLVRS